MLALLVAGCGGGGGGASRAAYIARADRICAAARTQGGPLVAQLTAAATGSLSSGSAAELAGVVGQLHAIEAHALAQLRALAQPSGDHDAIERFLGPSSQVVDAMSQAQAALSRGDLTGALGLLQQTQATAQQAKSAADSYGFKQCGLVLSAAT